MASLVCFHAHPDDESIATGGVLAQAVRDGHDVALVFATRGECGEVAEGFLDDGETLGDRREVEVAASAAALGVEHVHFLGYRDSGMIDMPTNDDPTCFWRADLDEAAGRLATVLREVSCDVLTIYDDHGGYGHPDHIQVHRVGLAAAAAARVETVFESTMNRDHIRQMIEFGREAGMEVGDAPDVGDEADFGSPDEIITTRVDVREFIDQKRASMRAHASQIGDDSMFLTMPDEMFREVFGWEFFIRRGVPSSHRDDGLFASA